MVGAMPMNEPRALVERGSSLTGKFLHITGKLHNKEKKPTTNTCFFRHPYRP